MVVGKYFEPIDSGSVLQTSALATALSGHGDLTVVELGFERELRGSFGPMSGEMGPLPYGGQARVIRGPGAPALAKLPKPRRIELRSKHGFGRLLAPRHGISEWTLEQVLAVDADLVVTVQIDFASPVLGGIRSPIVMMTHNHESSAAWRHLRRTTRAQFKEDAHRYWRVHVLERVGFPRAAQIWCVSNADAQRYAGNPIPADRIFVIPNVVPPTAFREDPPVGEAGNGVFFGQLGYPPNRDAVLTLAEMSNALSERGVRNEISVLGNGGGPELHAEVAHAPGLRFFGFVDDLMATLDRAAVVVVPLAFGGGTKLKVIEAMAAGRPVLTTPIGAEGIDGIVDGVHAVIRPLGSAFTDQAAEMLAEPERFAHIGRAGQSLVREHYGMAALELAVSNALGALDTRPVPGPAR